METKTYTEEEINAILGIIDEPSNNVSTNTALGIVGNYTIVSDPMELGRSSK